MQPISDYLKKLLYQYDCIVVPALGAFLTHGVSASYNEATGQFLPPRRKVAFNAALRLDDGILLNYVMLHENCSRDAAHQRISQFVADLNEQTRQQGSFTIDGLGMFTANAEGNLQFDPELRHNFLGNAYGLQPLLLTKQMVHPAVPMTEKSLVRPVIALSSAPIATSTALTVQEEHSVELGEVIPMPDTNPGREQSIGWRWAAAAMLVGSLGFISYFSIINPSSSFQSSLNPSNLFRVPAFLSVKPATTEVTAPANVPEAKKAEAKPATNVLAATLSSTPAAVAPAKPAIAPVPVVAPITKKGAPAPVAAEVVKAKPVAPVAVKKAEPVPAMPKDPFTVIAGSFANRGNAIRFQKRLVKAGYTEAYILPGRAKGLIKVAAIGTSDMAEAQQSLDSLNTLTGIRPFVMRSR